MTETEWLESEDPLALLVFVTDQATQRKYRLFLCACCTRVLAGIPPHHRHLDDIYSVTWHRLERAMAIVEQFAEGFVSINMLAQARQDAENSTHVPKWGSKDNKLSYEVAAVVTAAVEHPSAADVLEACWRATDARWAHTDQDEGNRCTVEMQWQATVCRDVFGNPFHPISFSPEWRTAATMSRAARITNRGILAQCRSWQTPCRTPGARPPLSSIIVAVPVRMFGAARWSISYSAKSRLSAQTTAS